MNKMRDGFLRALRPISLVCVIALGFMTIVATGGGGGGDSGDGPAPALKEGVFEDSIVEGLEYETATESGVTDSNGIFTYLDGETVTFTIGDIELGQALAKEWLCPIDLVDGATDATDPTVTNIARFLLTLDDDDNPDNGISIIESVREDAIGRSVDFSLGITEFENNPDIQQVVDSLTALTSAGQRNLISSSDAQEHLANLFPSVNPVTITVSIGETGTATITGGSSPYSVSTDDTSVATASINGNTVTVTGVAEGTATITIADSNSNSVSITVTVTTSEKQIPPGEWSGPAGFGELSFTVDSTSTSLIQLVVNYIDFSCGIVVIDGTSTVTSSWAITDRQFSITTGTFDGEITINGTFDETGKYASGTFYAVFYGTTCSGTWDATHCDSDGDGVSLADLAGTWYGVQEDPFGALDTISVTIDGSGNITQILIGGSDSGVTATVTKLPDHDQVFSYLDSEGTEGGFFVDASARHAAFVDEDFYFVVVEKGASSLPSYAFTDIVEGWSGYGFALDSNLDISEKWTSSATVASDYTFSGSNSIGENFNGSFTTYDSTYGGYYGEFSNSQGGSGPVACYLSPDKSFAASWAMDTSGTSPIFPEDVSFECWNKQ